MTDPAQFSPPFQRLVDGASDLIGLLAANPQAFERAILADGNAVLPEGAALLNQQMLGFLLFDRHGRRLPFPAPAWVPAVETFAGLEALAVRRSEQLLAIEHAGHSLHLIWTKVADAGGWNLPRTLREALAGHPEGRIAVITGTSSNVDPIDNAARGFALTDLERRVVVAIVATGHGRDAAARLGLAYPTVRQALASAAARMRQPNMPAVIHAVVGAAFGILPGDAAGAARLTDSLQLSERQAHLALLIATGMSRQDVALSMGLSPAVVKKELAAVYGALGLANSAELARLIVEVQALTVLARATDSSPGFFYPAVEPARTAVRAGGRETIGWSDYGPASGRPVLIVHSNWQCRYVPRPLIRALHKAGWRPIAIDRPGFGATHPGRSTAIDPFGQAIDDTLLILDRLNIERIAVIARDGSQFVQVLKAAAPHRVGPVVLVSPTLPTAASSKRVGIIGTMKEVFLSPSLTEYYFRLVCQQLTIARLEQLTRSLTRGSAIDTALCDDPEFIRDRFRAMRPFATGNLIGG